MLYRPILFYSFRWSRAVLSSQWPLEGSQTRESPLKVASDLEGAFRLSSRLLGGSPMHSGYTVKYCLRFDSIIAHKRIGR
jgi:hypothetical protein